MDLRKLTLSNFLSYKRATIEFPKDGVYLIVGEDKETGKSNGSGKSGILDGIFYSLENESTRDSIDSLIRLGTTKMEASLEFAVSEDIYVVERSKTPKTNSVKIFKNGKDLDLKIRDAQAYIDNLLGADSQIFRQTAYFKQGDLGAFSKLCPNEAKTLVMRILGLGVYDDYERLARGKLGALQGQLSEVRGRISANTQILANIRPVKEIVDISSIEAEIRDLTAKLEKTKTECDEQEKIRNSLTQESNKYLNIASKASGEMNGISKRLTKMMGLKDKCPLCGSVLVKEVIESVKKQLKDSYDKQNISRTTNDGKATEFSQKANRIDLRKYKQEINRLTDSLTTKRLKLTEYNTKSKEQQKENAKLLNIKKSIETDTLKLGSLQKVSDNYEKLILAFGKQGIQAYIIENVLPEIEATTNSILKGLNAHLRIILDSKRILKSGKTANALDIKILDELGERPYYNYSGGEKTLIDFAIRISLAIALARRANAQIQTLLLDEPFVALDAIGRNLMTKAIKYVQRTYGFRKIILISHQEEAIDERFRIIRVVKDREGSHIVK